MLKGSCIAYSCICNCTSRDWFCHFVVAAIIWSRIEITIKRKHFLSISENFLFKCLKVHVMHYFMHVYSAIEVLFLLLCCCWCIFDIRSHNHSRNKIQYIQWSVILLISNALQLFSTYSTLRLKFLWKIRLSIFWKKCRRLNLQIFQVMIHPASQVLAKWWVFFCCLSQ